MRMPVILGCCLLLTGMLAAEDEAWPIVWGEHVEGPMVQIEDLPGRVLLLATWDESARNVEWIRQLSTLRKRYGDKLLIVASHWGDKDYQGMLDTWTMVDGGERICLMVNTHMRGDTRFGRIAEGLEKAGGRGRGHRQARLGGIDRHVNYDQACLLFDHEGRLLMQDNIEAVSRRVPAAYQAAPGHLAHGREWLRFTDQAELLGAAERNMASTLGELREAMRGGDMVAIVEAEELLGRVEVWCQREMAKITEQRTLHATSCILRLSSMLAWLKGDDFGEPFRALQQELKGDKTFGAMLQAEAAIRAMRADARLMDLSDRAVEARRNKSYMKRITRIENTCRGIMESLPETAVAKEAEAMLAAYQP